MLYIGDWATNYRGQIAGRHWLPKRASYCQSIRLISNNIYIFIYEIGYRIFLLYTSGLNTLASLYYVELTTFSSTLNTLYVVSSKIINSTTFIYAGYFTKFLTTTYS